MKAIVLIGLLSILVCRVSAQNKINIWYKDCTNCASNDEDGSENYSYSDGTQFKIEDINHNFDRRELHSKSENKWYGCIRNPKNPAQKSRGADPLYDQHR